jgi:hypothetical protein
MHTLSHLRPPARRQKTRSRKHAFVVALVDLIVMGVALVLLYYPIGVEAEHP